MLSIVIPVLNEAESLDRLYDEIAGVIRAESYEADILFVDDGSLDASWQTICRLAESDPRVYGIRFRRNFGKAAAINAGVRQARGDRVLTMDADLQDDPREIPRFLAEIDRGFDLVSGWKQVRLDPWHKVFPSRVFNWLVSALTGVKLHDHNCGMKAYRREVFDEIRLYGELHRFIPVLASARGFRVGEIAIHHRPRQFGRSKYGVRRFVKGFLDLLTVKFLTGFGGRPQHLLGTIGLVSFLVGAAGLTYLAGYWIVSRWRPDLGLLPLHQRPAVLYSLAALLFGGQLLSIGLLAELITAYRSRDTDHYSIAEETDSSRTSDSGLHASERRATHHSSTTRATHEHAP